MVFASDNDPVLSVVFSMLLFFLNHYCFDVSGTEATQSVWKCSSLWCVSFSLSASLCFLHTGPPTNFGLAASWRARMEQQRAVEPTLSQYRASYPLHPISAFCYSHHVSMPKRFSSSQLPANLCNENLALKHKTCRQVSSNPASLLWPLPQL